MAIIFISLISLGCKYQSTYIFATFTTLFRTMSGADQLRVWNEIADVHGAAINSAIVEFVLDEIIDADGGDCEVVGDRDGVV